MENTTKIITAWELYQQKVSKIHIAEHLNKHRETIYLWIKGIQGLGIENFLEAYINSKKGKRKKRQLDPILKRQIWEIRERENGCCGQKIRYFLRREYGLRIAVSTIYTALHERYKIRSKWKKNQLRGHVPKASKAREVIQMDTVDFGKVFAFTGIDIYSKEADVLVAPELTSRYGFRFLKQSMDRRFDKFSELIQTDGGPEFKEEFKENVLKYCSRHRVARPYRKNEQSFIESFNRSLRKECLGWRKYDIKEIEMCKSRVESFLYKYHYHRPHISLGMRPPLTVKK